MTCFRCAPGLLVASAALLGAVAVHAAQPGAAGGFQTLGSEQPASLAAAAGTPGAAAFQPVPEQDPAPQAAQPVQLADAAVSPVPEPGGLAMALAGLGVIGTLALRRRVVQ